MGKLNFHGYLILQFYPTCEIRENLMHTKNMCFTVFIRRGGGTLSKVLRASEHPSPNDQVADCFPCLDGEIVSV